MALDLFILGMRVNPTVPQGMVYPETDSIKLLKSDPDIFRVMKMGFTFMGNTLSVYGLDDVGGHDLSRNMRYIEFLRLIDNGVENIPQHGTLLMFDRVRAKIPSKLINMLNVKYVVSEPTEDVPPGVVPDAVQQGWNMAVEPIF